MPEPRQRARIVIVTMAGVVIMVGVVIVPELTIMSVPALTIMGVVVPGLIRVPGTHGMQADRIAGPPHVNMP